MRGPIIELLVALDFLHSHGHIEHTGIFHCLSFLFCLDIYWLCLLILLKISTQETCSSARIIVSYFENSKRRNSHPPYLANQSHLLEPSIFSVPCSLKQVRCSAVFGFWRGQDRIRTTWRGHNALGICAWSYPVGISSVGLTVCLVGFRRYINPSF